LALARRPLELDEADHAVVTECKHAIGQQGVMMDVQIEATSEAMGEADRADPRALPAFAARLR